MKKFACLLLCAMLCLGTFSGCGTTVPDVRSDTLNIVTTVFPLYDWIKNIVGDIDGVELTMLMDSGVDLHSYQPTVDDMVRISQCDLFVYVGGESDKWTKDALSGEAKEGRVALNLMQALGSAAREEEQVEGMEGEEAEEEEAEDEGPEYDEHIWLSVRCASTLCGSICEALCGLDPDNRDAYEANTAVYREKLDELDVAYAEAVASGNRDTLLFADRFPFRYLTEDYGLHYYAAFLGCSAETEASFETVAFLAAKTDELGLRCLMKLEGGDGKLCRTVQQATQTKDQQILTMDSLQSVTAKDLESGISYLSVMEKNLEVLRQALA